MCGRFVQKAKPAEISERFKVALPPQANWSPRYNLAPTQPAAVIIDNGGGRRRLDFFSWGLVPAWAPDCSRAATMINARIETLWEKKSFHDCVRYRRCLVPANGFYEWRADGQARKTPYYFSWPDQPLFAWAGLWAVWNDRQGGECYTFTLITCPANESVRPYHHRMPVAVPPETESRWLDHRLYRPAELQPVLAQGATIAWQAYAVSPRVGQVKWDDPACIEPAPTQAQFDWS